MLKLPCEAGHGLEIGNWELEIFLDIFAHGLWSGLIFNKHRGRKIFWPIFFGVAPDLFSFGIYLTVFLLSRGNLPFNNATDHLNTNISQYTDILYKFTHSLVIFATVFLLVWLMRKKPFWPLLTWGIHIGIDVFSHSAEFFPTPFLFPLSSFKVTLISWGNIYFLIANYSILAIIYFLVFLQKNKHKHLATYFKEKRKLLKR